jgi:hypothetical protein
MSRRDYAKSQLFLMEFIIVVLFFALCTSVCISAFVKADSISKGSKELNDALILAQSAAESIKGLNYNELDRLSGLTGLYQEEKNKFRGYYSKNFESLGNTGKTSEDAKAVYVMETTLSVKDKMLTASITVREKSSKDNICRLEIKKYLPDEV